MGVAFCLAGEFVGFCDVIVGVGPWGRFLVVGEHGRGGGGGWRRRRREGVHGRDKAEGDGEETREDDRGGFVVVVGLVIKVILAIKVVLAIIVVFAIIVIFAIIVVLAIIVIVIVLDIGVAIVIIAVLVVYRLEGSDRLVAGRAGNLCLYECTEMRLGWIGRGKRVGYVPDDDVPVFGVGFGVVFGGGGGGAICGRVLLAEKAEALSECTDEGGFGLDGRAVAGEGDAEELGCLAIRPANGRAREGHVFGGAWFAGRGGLNAGCGHCRLFLRKWTKAKVLADVGQAFHIACQPSPHCYAIAGDAGRAGHDELEFWCKNNLMGNRGSIWVLERGLHRLFFSTCISRRSFSSYPPRMHRTAPQSRARHRSPVRLPRPALPRLR